MNTESLSNPFRGLRPFVCEDDHLFFGREQIVDQLLMRLRQTRFLSVIGSSGCGKSSLIQAGLIPSLYSGYMTQAGSSWRVAIMRPGADPIGNLARALSQPDILGHDARLEDASPVVNEATIIRSNYGLVDCIRLARIPQNENILIVVDQFEELFRFKDKQFKHKKQADQAREDAHVFVKRLTHAATQSELPIYIVLTMRSDFIGECNEYPGLPEAINEGQFLVPRMTRTQLRSAISGPVMVGGSDISPRLLVKLLNDVGDNPDRLPILQHALMRTWDFWFKQGRHNEPLDLEHYQAIGTMEAALSSHADEVFEALDSDKAQHIAASVFKCLTDILADSRGLRRPTTLKSLAEIAQAEIHQVTQVIDQFRLNSRAFLTPTDDIELIPDSVIDITHESLMRVWEHLIRWTKEEKTSAQTYLRLSRAASRYEKGTAGLWRDPELQIGLRWLKSNQPSTAWAALYNNHFNTAIAFLEKSKAEREHLEAEKRKAHRQRLQTAWGVAFVLLIFAVYALVQQQTAERQQARAEQNFHLAVTAVDEMLADVVVESSLADIPQTEELRQQLLEKTRHFYESLQEDRAADVNLRLEAAVAQVRLGKIYQLQSLPTKAESTLLKAIQSLRDLHKQFPEQALIQHRLGEAYNWYGAQVMQYNQEKAESAFHMALKYHQDLVTRFDEEYDYRYELARGYNNLGILLGADSKRAEEAEKHFQLAISFFKTLTNLREEPSDAWRLARTQNGLGGLLRRMNQAEKSAQAYNEAIDLVKQLLEQAPDKREYMEGLARFYNNLGNVYLTSKEFDAALIANNKARQLFETLATPIPELRNEIANSYNTQSAILRRQDRIEEATQAVKIAIKHYTQLENSSPKLTEDPNFNNRFGGFLASFAILRIDSGETRAGIKLITQAVTYFLKAVNSAAPSSGYQKNLSNAYWLLAKNHLKIGNFRASKAALESLLKRPLDKNRKVSAAGLLVQAIGLVNHDTKLKQFKRDQLAESYTSMALSLLQQAVNKGYSKDILIKQSEVGGKFHPLGKHQDFQKIIAGGKGLH